MNATCAECGKEFEKKGSAKCCSGACSETRGRRRACEYTRKYRAVPENRRRRNANNRLRAAGSGTYLIAMRATCVICGKEFEPVGKRTKTCGRECSSRNRRQLTRNWEIENKDQINKRRRERHAANPEKRRERARLHYAANKDSLNKYTQDWRRRNPEKARQIDQRRRSKRKLSPAQRLKSLEQAREWKRRNAVKYRDGYMSRDRTRRAAEKLGIPKILYAAMKVLQTQEQSHA